MTDDARATGRPWPAHGGSMTFDEREALAERKHAEQRAADYQTVLRIVEEVGAIRPLPGIEALEDRIEVMRRQCRALGLEQGKIDEIVAALRARFEPVAAGAVTGPEKASGAAALGPRVRGDDEKKGAAAAEPETPVPAEPAEHEETEA